MGTAIKHPVRDRVKPSFVIFDVRTLTLSPERQRVRMSKITNDGGLNPVWHRMLHNCTHMATVGVIGLTDGRFYFVSSLTRTVSRVTVFSSSSSHILISVGCNEVQVMITSSCWAGGHDNPVCWSPGVETSVITPRSLWSVEDDNWQPDHFVIDVTLLVSSPMSSVTSVIVCHLWRSVAKTTLLMPCRVCNA